MSLMKQKFNRYSTVFMPLLTGLAVMGGCTYYTDYSSFISEPRPLVTLTEYHMAPPDEVQITSKRVREIDRHREQIAPDGRITVPLLGSVFVAGRTCADVAAELEAKARDFYEDADVTMRVTSFRSKKIYVFGEVGAPGPYSYDGANTVLETLATAQPTRLADPSRIHVLRPNKDGELIRRMTINLDKMIKEGDTALDAVLEEGDIVYVPANGLAAVGLALQQLLLPLQPMAMTIQRPTEIDDSARTRTYGGNEVQ